MKFNDYIEKYMALSYYITELFEISKYHYDEITNRNIYSMICIYFYEQTRKKYFDDMLKKYKYKSCLYNNEKYYISYITSDGIIFIQSYNQEKRLDVNYKSLLVNE